MSNWIKTRRTQYRPQCVVSYDCWEKLTTVEQLRQREVNLFTSLEQPPNRTKPRTAREAYRQQANAPKRNKRVISTTSRKRLKKVCELAGMSAEKQRIWREDRMRYEYFRLGFITLNLSHEEHNLTDVEYKKFLIDPFLDWLTKTVKVGMYIIRHELKKSGQIHSHLIIDKYIHYTDIRKKWNELQAKAGVIALYRGKFSKMRYSEYERYRMRQGSKDKVKIKKAYARGVATGWNDPNSTDVKQVSSITEISNYIAKYVGKTTGKSGNTQSNEEPKPPRELDIDHWSASRNLLKAQYFSVIDGYNEEIHAAKLASKIKWIERGKNVINIYILPIYQALKTGSKWLIDNYVMWKESVRAGNKGLITKYIDQTMIEVQPVAPLISSTTQPKELPPPQLDFDFNPYKFDYNEDEVF